MLAMLLSALHVLSLGGGFGAVFARGRALRAVAGGESGAARRVLFADTCWGLADDLETALVVAIPFVAPAMARGLWLLA